MPQSTPSIWKEPLDPSNFEIRLLQLQPSKDINELPRGKLVVKSLNSHPSFDAISHTWGSPQASVVLQFGLAQWPVTNNLAAAFRHLRDKTNVREFWVDALCINQFDDEERRQQIALLRQIFFTAKTVRVWLGHGSDAMNRATYAIGQVGKGKVVGDVQDNGQPLSKSDFENLGFFYSGEWWQRLWVKQEIALASQVVFHYGQLSVAMELLDRAGKETYRYLETTKKENTRAREELMKSVSSALDLKELVDLKSHASKSAKLKVSNVVRLLQISRKARVTDPRDRVYGFLGICAQMFDQELKHRSLMEADYTKDVAYVYTIFAYKLIEASKSLFLFNQVSPLHNSLRDLPSWVSDWTSFYHHHVPSLFMAYKFHPADAKPENPSKAAPVLDQSKRPMRLSLKGYIIGTVNETHRIYQDDKGLLDAVKTARISVNVSTWQRNYLNARSQAYKEPLGECSLGPFASVISGSFEDAFSRHHDTRQDEQILKLVRDEVGTAPRKVVEKVRNTISNYRFFICSVANNQANPGLGPADMQVGDRVALLEGGAVAYILRQSVNKNEGNLFNFVGECFVHGVMRGECVPAEKPSTIVLE